MKTLQEMNFNFKTTKNTIKTLGTLVFIAIGFVMVLNNLNIVNI